MHISDTEASSLILSQKVYFQKIKKKYLKRAETSWNQKGWCN